METIDIKKWKSYKKMGYASIINGKRHILKMTKEGTSSVPVKLIKTKL